VQWVFALSLPGFIKTLVNYLHSIQTLPQKVYLKPQKLHIVRFVLVFVLFVLVPIMKKKLFCIIQTKLKTLNIELKILTRILNYPSPETIKKYYPNGYTIKYLQTIINKKL